MIHIRYFGQLADQLNVATEDVPWSGGTTDDLLQLLRQRGEPWASVLQTSKIFKIAVNRQLTHTTTDIVDGADIGILPPVTGG
ncbi:MoaD/ThiS family protein [Hydromonas duriensis]|nr:MoaD/ThiS family protein [Hydromonas duriensis]